MKDELERVRNLTVNRLQHGAVPGWSWNQHVHLVEAIDAVLQDMAVLAGPSLTEPPEPRRHAARRVRLVESEDQREQPVGSYSRTKAKTRNLH